MILHIWKPKAPITAKQPGPGGSSLRCDFFFRRRVVAINLNRPQGVRVNRSTCRLAEPAEDWAAKVQEVAPGSAELAWAVMGFLASVLRY